MSPIQKASAAREKKSGYHLQMPESVTRYIRDLVQKVLDCALPQSKHVISDLLKLIKTSPQWLASYHGSFYNKVSC